MTHHQPAPQHRGQPAHANAFAELSAMAGDDHTVAARWSTIHHSPDHPHYVLTAHERNEHTGQVLMVLSPEAAGMLAEIIQRFASTHPKPGLAMETYDRDLWQHVAVDLVRNKVLASHDTDTVVTATLYGGPRPTQLEVVR